ncbi:hypothetical protein F5141DRAFT_1293378 [Pisolithus sp. B1]|nr:hypothetical protein F5141DRAFT_1293378 [Pisolithus sp. B1]
MTEPYFRLVSYYWLDPLSRISSLSMSAGDTAPLKDAWVHPGVLSVLTLIGPDVIQRALAQLSGHRFTPVAFSFGWVAYSFSNLVLAVGNNKLIPEPDFSSILINGRTGVILSRILRDFEHWRPREALPRTTNLFPYLAPVQDSVSIFRADPTRAFGVPVADWIYYSGLATAVVQLIVAAIPLILHDNWVILLATSAGIVLAFATVLWIAHLITVVNIQQDPWFLMLVGSIGMMHNVMVAGLLRTPQAFGIPLVFEECILDRKVMQTLMKVEERHPHLGASMLQTFFPGKLYPEEEAFWEKKAQEADKRDAAEKAVKKASVTQGSPSSPTVITSSSPTGLV